MIEVTDEMLADMVLAIVRDVGPEYIYLFGHTLVVIDGKIPTWTCSS